MARVKLTEKKIDKLRLLPNEKSTLESGIRRFADAEKSDPFAYNRAMSHLDQGILGYDARAVEESHVLLKPDGERQDYKVTVFKDIARP